MGISDPNDTQEWQFVTAAPLEAPKENNGVVEMLYGPRLARMSSGATGLSAVVWSVAGCLVSKGKVMILPANRGEFQRWRGNFSVRPWVDSPGASTPCIGGPMAAVITSEIWFRRKDNSVDVIVRGNATQVSAHGLREYIKEQINRRCERLVFDFQLCNYVDSTFLGTLVKFSMLLKQMTGVPVCIARARPQIYEAFASLGVAKFFDFAAGASFESTEAEGFERLVVAPPSYKQHHSAVVESHRALIDADQTNVARFQDLLNFLEAEVPSKPDAAPFPQHRTGQKS